MQNDKKEIKKIYYNKKMETMSLDEMAVIQGERLVKLVEHAYTGLKFYRAKMDAIGLLPGDIKGIEDLTKLPFTYKQDLRDAYPYDAFAVPMGQVRRIHASSGTTGQSTVVGYTKNDLHDWAESIARSLASCGVDHDDILHISYGYGMFTGGLGLHDGGTMLGCSVIPVSSGNTKRQLQIMHDFKSTVLACTPSYALYLGDELAEMGCTPDDIYLKAGFFGAEPWTENMRLQIEARLGLHAYNIYGLSEVAGPGVANECWVRQGMHVQHDYYYPEIINPQTGEVLPDNEYGELVFTCLTKEAIPLIRYRTRDLTCIERSKCTCGRTSPRLQRITGRSDDMLIVRGVNVFPSQIESVLLQYNEVLPHYMIYLDRKDNLDTIEVQVEMSAELFSDTVKNISAVEKRMKKDFSSALLITPEVKLVEPKSIPRSEGKAVRVIDRRKMD